MLVHGRGQGVGLAKLSHVVSEAGRAFAEALDYTALKIPAGEAQRDFIAPRGHAPGHGPGTRHRLDYWKKCGMLGMICSREN